MQSKYLKLQDVLFHGFMADWKTLSSSMMCNNAMYNLKKVIYWYCVW